MPSLRNLVPLTLAILAFSLGSAFADGEPDMSFATDGIAVADLGSRVDQVAGVQVAPGGRIVVAGDTQTDTSRDLVVAAFTAVGAPDVTFAGTGRVLADFGGDETASALAIDRDGSIVAVGTRSKDGLLEVVLVRYRANGTLDSSFNGNGRRVLSFTDGADNLGQSVAFDLAGRIVVAGTRTTATGSVFAVARLLPDGSLDTTFNNSGKRFIDFGLTNGTNAFGQAVAVQDDGKIVIAGTRVGAKGSDFALARLNPDGTFDLGFDSSGKTSIDFGATDEIHALAIAPDGRIAVAGTRANTGGSDFAVAVLRSDGQADTDFKGNGKATTDFGADEVARAIVVQADGRIVVAGQRQGTTGNDFAVARYDMDGSLDPTLDGDGKVRVDLRGDSADSASGVALQADGKIVVAGNTTAQNDVDLGIVRLSSNPGTPVGVLENPSPGSRESGIGVISGWLCAAPSVGVRIDGQPLVTTAYGTTRGDTKAACGDTNNGFGLLFNWSLLGDGPHVIRGFAQGKQFATAVFDVQTLGTTFLHDASGTFTINGFPNAASSIDLTWAEPLQGFVIKRFAAVKAAAVPPQTPITAAGGAIPGVLENPAPDSFQSGIGLISGWTCAASAVQIRIDNRPAVAAAYGTSRGDTLGVCGDTNNGFGLLFNWSLLGDGAHTIEARADGRLIGTASFTVTKLGATFLSGASGKYTLPDFPQGGRSVDVEWAEGQQKFVIVRMQ